MNVRLLGMIFLLGCMWGTSFLLIKIAILDIPPITVAFLRLFVGALILWVVVLFQRQPIEVKGKQWVHLMVMGLFACALPFTLISVAEQYIDSAIAGVLNGLTPLITILLAHVFISSEQLSLKKLLGVLSGFMGLTILLLPVLFEKELMADLWSILAVVVAALSYAVGIVYGRYFLSGQHGLYFPATQLSFAALALLPIVGVFEFTSWSVSETTWKCWGAIFMLGIWGTALAFVMYYRILHAGGAVALSLVTYLLPLIGLILGVVILEEELHISVYAAGALILFGMLLASGSKIKKQSEHRL